MRQPLAILGALALAALPAKGQEIEIDFSKIPSGRWEMDFERDKLTGKPTSDEKTVLRWFSPKAEGLPEEWLDIKSFEEEGELATLTVRKKDLEAEGEIIPLEEFTKIKDPSKIDRKAMRRSLLHLALTKAEMDEVSQRPVNMKRFQTPGAAEILEHYGGLWPERKMYQWLAADILTIEYMRDRPEDHWKTGALCGATDLVSAVRGGRLGKLPETFSIGAAVAFLYLVPNLEHAVPQSVGYSETYIPNDCLIALAGLYSRAGVFPHWYPNLHATILELDRRFSPGDLNMRAEMFAEIFIREGRSEEGLAILQKFEPRFKELPKTDARIRKRIEELEAEGDQR